MIPQLDDQNTRKQFDLIASDNHRVIAELSHELRQYTLAVSADTGGSHAMDTRPMRPTGDEMVATNNECTPTEHTSADRTRRCSWPGCSYSTRFSANMTRHLYVHSGEKPYVCDWPQCHKRYQQSSALVTHKRTHVNAKPFACDWIGCDYRTNNRCSLPAHRRTHYGIKAFACDWPQCSVTCSTRTHLRDHRLIHTKDKPFKCDVCEQSFSKKSNMTAHKLSVHLGVKRVRNKNNCDPEVNQLFQ
ncbi:unnamed protein product [Oppiella nova]|uniref:C2H2-type domain-containing protein n=1 Tax=Oppiella nova TaxID=334625 RepID=A0A7R9M8F7_9ACAR|nr:unnamed protein product [Oppiella nova]CAG2172704.1 unnamed protein product [Oppiella nova]